MIFDRQWNFEKHVRTIATKVNETVCSTRKIQKTLPTLVQKLRIKDFFSKCDQIRSLSLFFEEIFNGKLHFLYSASAVVTLILKQLFIFFLYCSNILEDRVTLLSKIFEIFSDISICTELFCVCCVSLAEETELTFRLLFLIETDTQNFSRYSNKLRQWNNGNKLSLNIIVRYFLITMKICNDFMKI